MKLWGRPKNEDKVDTEKFAYLPTRVTCQRTGKKWVVWLEKYVESKVYYDIGGGDGFWDKSNWINWRPWEERWKEARDRNKLNQLYKQGYVDE